MEEAEEVVAARVRGNLRRLDLMNRNIAIQVLQNRLLRLRAEVHEVAVGTLRRRTTFLFNNASFLTTHDSPSSAILSRLKSLLPYRGRAFLNFFSKHCKVETVMPNTKSRNSNRFAQALPRGKQGGVQLLLIQSVDHLGKQGDVVEVKPGYALNYLLPQGMATIASPHHQRMVEKHKAELLEREKQRLASYRQLADALTRHSVTIEANANDEGHLYGSVGAVEISSALKQSDFSVLPDQVRLEGPLKELGLYTVKIHLHQEIEADLKVWVVPTVTGQEASK